jgi:diguanylate cyclase (GGDEF)-like protein
MGNPRRQSTERRSFGLGRVVLIVAVMMVVVEFLIMLVLSNVPLGISGWPLNLLDALLLAAVVAPLTYWGLIRPQERKLGRALDSLEAARARAEEHARIDALTAVLSRRAIFEALGREWARATRYAQNLSCIMLDIDHFKKLNDEHGHLLGDQMLRLVADAIARACRDTDAVGRYGGEEFLVIAPETGIKGAVELAERIREAVAAVSLQHHGAEIRATISAGVASRNPDIVNPTVLIDLADTALFRAKKEGRNRVAAHGGSTDVDGAAPMGPKTSGAPARS